MNESQQSMVMGMLALLMARDKGDAMNLFWNIMALLYFLNGIYCSDLVRGFLKGFTGD